MGAIALDSITLSPDLHYVVASVLFLVVSLIVNESVLCKNSECSIASNISDLHDDLYEHLPAQKCIGLAFSLFCFYI